MNKSLVLMFCGVALFLSGCGGQESAPTVLPALSLLGMGLGIGDLVGDQWRATARRRIDTYLSEIEAAGYRKSIRMVLDRDFGPELLVNAVPVIRARGFALLAILAQRVKRRTPGGDIIELEKDIAWLHECLPQVRDILCGVQLSNEEWNDDFGGGPGSVPTTSPEEFAAWHNALSPIVRELAPGVPLCAGDIGHARSRRWWEAVLTAGLKDYDAISNHVYSVKDLYGPANKPVWVTEAGDLSYHRPWQEKFFLYVWNEQSRWGKRPGGGIL